MKIKLGKSRITTTQAKLGFDVNTTASFGHCQPLMVKEMVPQSSFSVEIDNFVRTSPLVSPTFGRIKNKIWHSFVPIADLYEPFENMLAQQSYNGGNLDESYVPTSVPSINLGVLSKIIYNLDMAMGVYSGASGSMTTQLGQQDYQASAVTVDNILIGGRISLCTADSATTKPTNVKSILGTLQSSMPWKVNGVWHNSYTASSESNMTSAIYRSGSTDSGLSLCLNTVESNSLARSGKSVYSKCGTPTNFDQCWVWNSGATDYYFFQKLSDRQKRIRKVLIGCGYQLDATNNSEVSILPLCAYYKAWFDTLMPQRNELTWTDTNCFKLLHYISNFNVDLTNLTSMGPGDGDMIMDLIVGFLNDLADTYYYDDADYYTAHIKKTADFVGNSVTVPYADYDGIDPTPSSPLGATLDNQPALYNSQTLSDVQIRLIQLLTKFVNKNTIIGGKISEYLRVHYGAAVQNAMLKANFIGGDSTDIQISDVMSNANTGEATLGEYAGKGVGYSDGKNFKFKADTFGYWVAFSAIVPKSRFYQGIDPNLLHRDRFTFFAPEFDALGFSDSSVAQIYNGEGVYIKPVSGGSLHLSDSHFGFIPRYSEYKTSIKNVVNGDMSLPSLRNSLAQYNIDKMITVPQSSFGSVDNSGKTYNEFTLTRYDAPSLIVDPYLREIGKNFALGNYNRIFYANDTVKALRSWRGDIMNASVLKFIYNFGLDDEFICHNIINIDATLPMIPISESFNTDGEDKDAVTVDKA